MAAKETKPVDPDRLTVGAVKRILSEKMPMSTELKMRIETKKDKVRVVTLSTMYDGDGIYFRVVESLPKKESIFLHRSITAAVKKYNS